MIEIQDFLHGTFAQKIADSVMAILNKTADIPLPGLGRITGQVLDSITNKPVRGAEVELFHRYVGFFTGTKKSADENGQFEFLNVPTGDWSVIIRYPCCAAVRDFSLKEGETVSIGTVDLNAFPTGYGRITGKVIDSTTNEPLKGVKVRLYCTGGFSPDLGAISDEQGNFEVANVPSRTWHITFNYDPKHLSNSVHNIKIEINQTVSTGTVKLRQARVHVN